MRPASQNITPEQIMTEHPIPQPEQVSRKDSDQTPPAWSGFSEIDRAIAENRLMEYRWKKSWADPWGRRLAILVMLLFAAFAVFVIFQDALKS